MESWALPDEVHRFPEVWFHVSMHKSKVEMIGPRSALLNLPILRSVHTEILGYSDSIPYWRGVKKLICSCLKVKVLRIGGCGSGADYFPFEEGDVWPPFEKMKFDLCNLDQPVLDKYSRYINGKAFGTWDSEPQTTSLSS